jgi:hypothetical protein
MKLKRSDFIVGVIAIVFVAFCVRFIWFGGVFQTHEANEPNRKAMVQILDGIHLDAAYEDVLKVFWQHREHSSLGFHVRWPHEWSVRMPFEFGGTEWTLYIKFQDGRVTAAYIRNSDGKLPKGAPKDKQKAEGAAARKQRGEDDLGSERLKEIAAIPSSSIRFNENFAEYRIHVSCPTNSKFDRLIYTMRYDPFTGRRLSSAADALFAKPSEEEVKRIHALLNDAHAIADVIAKIGKPDRESHDLGFIGIKAQCGYTNLSSTVDLVVQEGTDGTFSIACVPKRIEKSLKE